MSIFARELNAIGYFLMASAVGLLIAQSMQHRIVERGCDSGRIVAVTGRPSVLAMLPFALSIGFTFYVVLERHAGSAFATAAGVLFLSSAILFWFGIEQFMKNIEEHISEDGTQEHNTPIDARIEHLLTEARVLLPALRPC